MSEGLLRIAFFPIGSVRIGAVAFVLEVFSGQETSPEALNYVVFSSLGSNSHRYDGPLGAQKFSKIRVWEVSFAAAAALSVLACCTG